MTFEDKGKFKTSHGLRLMSNLENLLRCRVICDFTIHVEESSFPVHRAVLAACSEYFRAMLSEDIDQGIVYINGIEPEAMEKCIDFMYTGEAEVSMDNAESVLNAADLLQLDELMDLCYAYLRSNITAENCLDMRNIVAVYDNVELRSTLENFIVHNMTHVAETAAFKQTEKADMKYYLKLCKGKSKSRCKSGQSRTQSAYTPRIFLSAGKSRAVKGHQSRALRSASSAPAVIKHDATKFVLWKSVINWIYYAPEQREKDLHELLKFLKITKYPLDFLSTTAWEEPLVQSSDLCKELIIAKALSNIGDLKSTVNIRNCFNFYQMTTLYSGGDFQRVLGVIITFMANNLNAIKKRPEVVRWEAEEICLFLKSCNSTSLKEDDLWGLAVTWFKCEDDRQDKALEVIKALGIEKFSPQFVIANVLKHPFIKESESCIAHLAETVLRDPKLLIWSTDLNTCFILKYLSRKYPETIFAEVENELFSFLVMNFLKAIEQREFKSLLYEDLLKLCKILRKRNIHGEAKWKAIMKWMYYDQDNRKPKLPHLLKTISFERLSSTFMKHTVREESLVKNSAECSDVVMKAVYNMLP